MAVKAITASMLMPLRGDKRWAYLERSKSMRVATLDEDGAIYLSPLWYVVHEQRIFLPLDAGSRHGVNVEAGRAMSAVVDAGDEYATVHGVRIVGSAKAVEDPALVETLQGLVFEKYFYTGHPFAGHYMDFGVYAGRRYFEIVVEKMIGWDMREITMPQVPEARVLPDGVGDRLLPDDGATA